MASVFELSEPYRNHLVSVLPPGPGVCAICWRAVDPGYRLCYPCRIARDAYGRRLAEVVVPIALAVKLQQLAHELLRTPACPRRSPPAPHSMIAKGLLLPAV